MPSIPIEYILAAAVAVIVIVLLVAAAIGGKKKTVRRVVSRPNNLREDYAPPNASNDELTRQIARAADALEALLAHLKASGAAPAAPVQQTAVRQTPPRTPEIAVQAPLRAQGVAEPPVPERIIPEPVAAAPPTAEPSSAEASAESTEQKPHRIKLSMFGR